MLTSCQPVTVRLASAHLVGHLQNPSSRTPPRNAMLVRVSNIWNTVHCRHALRSSTRGNAGGGGEGLTYAYGHPCSLRT